MGAGVTAGRWAAAASCARSARAREKGRRRKKIVLGSTKAGRGIIVGSSATK
jgi:hypothetical protein